MRIQGRQLGSAMGSLVLLGIAPLVFHPLRAGAVLPIAVHAGAPGQASVREPGVGDLAQRVTALMPSLMDQGVVPGVQVAVVRDGALAWQGAFGVANATTRAPVTDDSVFEAASLTKPLFAYAVLTLVDEGRLDLDTPLVTYLPGRYDIRDDERVERITVRHVLSHRTGLPNWRNDGPLKIHFSPGERFSYSGEGFVFLAAVVERITGETTEAFVRRRVFEPLGMTSSSLVWQGRYDALKVHGHDVIGEVAGRNTPWRANAAASLHTTARDYARFAAAAMGGTGLKPETTRQMFSPQARLDEGGFNTATAAPTGRIVASLAWGLGWGLEQDGDTWSAWHWGDNGPVKAFVAASPSRRFGLVVFLNSQNGLAIVPPLVTSIRGGPGAAFDWLKVREPVPAFGRFVRTLRDHGAAAALDEYRAARRERPGEAPLAESTMNSVGYGLLRVQKNRDAILVFEQNAADYPQSWNVHDSLGEALAADGQTERAIKAYQRSLELNPSNLGGTEALKKLRR